MRQRSIRWRHGAQVALASLRSARAYPILHGAGLIYVGEEAEPFGSAMAQYRLEQQVRRYSVAANVPSDVARRRRVQHRTLGSLPKAAAALADVRERLARRM